MKRREFTPFFSGKKRLGCDMTTDLTPTGKTKRFKLVCSNCPCFRSECQVESQAKLAVTVVLFFEDPTREAAVFEDTTVINLTEEVK